MKRSKIEYLDSLNEDNLIDEIKNNCDVQNALCYLLEIYDIHVEPFRPWYEVIGIADELPDKPQVLGIRCPHCKKVLKHAIVDKREDKYKYVGDFEVEAYFDKNDPFKDHYCRFCGQRFER